MFNKKLLTALLVAVGAISAQARVVAHAQVPKIYAAEVAVAPSDEYTYSIHFNTASEALEAKMYEIARSGGEWLSEDELLQYTRASDDQVEKVKSYLSKFGGKNMQLNKWGDKLSVTHSIKEVNEAWKANLTHYKHTDHGHTLIRTSEYTVPDELDDAILNVHPFTSFTNLERAIPIKNLTEEENAALERRTGAGCSAWGVSIECIRNQYGTVNYTPKPQNGTLDALVIGLIGQYVSESDLTQFLQKERPDQSAYKIGIETAAGGINNQKNPGSEAMLDVETVAGLAAPLNTKFLSYGTPSSSQSLLDVFLYILNME